MWRHRPTARLPCRGATQHAKQAPIRTPAPRLVLLLVLFAFGAPYRSGKAGRYNPQGGAHGCATFL
ncbi:hypothetical protein XpiCFBP4643_15000 [Xanthomonas pisi]|uniref:Uncharacterized protein n=1 Tax=Xanthomonas pisi TaxID=56457 RepID=A0A2S7D128_9XANT|nr:hypothetical protein XpiCFBP4643_15000 [Xanthomonas pisi]